MATNDKIVLGIDPGTQIMGYGLICIKNNQTSLDLLRRYRT
jgi:Holliday junction resolvasome RuvABC endonuclease subunit